MIPSDLSDFNRYGGLYRHVNLAYVPATQRGARADRQHHRDRQGADVSVKARLYNPGGLKDTVQVEIKVTDPAGKVIHTSTKSLPAWTGEQELAAFPVADPALWSPKTPHLYRCSRHRRRARTANSRWKTASACAGSNSPRTAFSKLNGEKLFLRGTQRHEDHAGLAAALTDDLIRQEFQLVKEMGCNFIRLGHYQGSRLALEMCDELGLVVWEEIPWCRGGVGGEQYREQARRMLRNMIDQHRNHPSVIFWGLGNENDWPGDFETFDEKAVRAFMSELNDIAHKADPSRMTAIRRCPFAADVPDVYSPSIWAGWYSGRYTEYKASTEKEAKKVDRMLHIEWGGDSHARRHSEDPDTVIAKISTGQGVEEKDRAYLLTGGTTRASKDGDWSETYICNLFDWHLKEQETMDFLAGSAHVGLQGFLHPAAPRKSRAAHEPEGRGGARHDAQGRLLRLPVLLGGEADGADLRPHLADPLGRRRRAEDGQGLLQLRVRRALPQRQILRREAAQQPGLPLRRIALDGRVPGRRESSARGGDEGRRRRSPTKCASAIRPRSGTSRRSSCSKRSAAKAIVVTVQARLLDAKGVQCLDARNAVRFAIAGDGELLQNLGTSTGSRQVELYNGRAIIRARLKKGEAAVTVSGDKLPTALLTVKA